MILGELRIWARLTTYAALLHFTQTEEADSGDSRLQKEEQLFAEESLLGKYLVLGGEEVELR